MKFSGGNWPVLPPGCGPGLHCLRPLFTDYHLRYMRLSKYDVTEGLCYKWIGIWAHMKLYRTFYEVENMLVQHNQKSIIYITWQKCQIIPLGVIARRLGTTDRKHCFSNPYIFRLPIVPSWPDNHRVKTFCLCSLRIPALTKLPRWFRMFFLVWPFHTNIAIHSLVRHFKKSCYCR